MVGRHAKQPSADMDILDRLEARTDCSSGACVLLEPQVDALRPSRSMEGEEETAQGGSKY